MDGMAGIIQSYRAWVVYYIACADPGAITCFCVTELGRVREQGPFIEL